MAVQKKRTQSPRIKYGQKELRASYKGIHIPGAWLAITFQFIGLIFFGGQIWYRFTSLESTVAKLEERLEVRDRGEIVSTGKFSSIETKLNNVEKQLDRMVQQLDLLFKGALRPGVYDKQRYLEHWEFDYKGQIHMNEKTVSNSRS